MTDTELLRLVKLNLRRATAHISTWSVDVKKLIPETSWWWRWGGMTTGGGRKTDTPDGLLWAVEILARPSYLLEAGANIDGGDVSN